MKTSRAEIVMGFAAAALFFPALVEAQSLARQSLSTFPDDTHQLAYTNLSELRASPNYSQIRQRLMTRQFRDFLDFLRSMGTDPDKDVDEAVLGWRGPAMDNANFFGLAGGRFDPDKARAFFAHNRLASQQYAGQEIYAFGSGQDPGDVFFVFLDNSTAAFGHLRDLKALLDARAGNRLALESISNYVTWEGELEGTSPQWGILTGKGALNLAGPWLTGDGKLAIDPASVLGPVQTVLYHIDWGHGVSARLSILCQTAENAEALSRLLALWRDAQQSAPTKPANNAPVPPDVDVRTDGSRVELSVSGSLALLDSLAH